MEEAVALQEGLNYTEPPYWYYPAKQTLAAMVLKSGDAERAESLFIESLAEIPNNGWAYAGLEKAYRAQRDKGAAKYTRSLFKRAWAGKKAPEPAML
jgi:tetratricopeptide (TPR) repeat protein